MSHADFEQMWRDLASVGRSSETGGYFRQPFGSAERECHAWFLEQCAARDLEVESDGNGNLVAWWRPAEARRGSTSRGGSTSRDGRTGGVVTGSHLDSVLDGGAFDGPLGVVSALAAVDLLRERGFEPAGPIGVSVFVEEEGSRFGLACLGSRLLTGTTTPEQARELRDRDGVFLLDAMAAAGLEPRLGPSALLDGIDCFVELHVEQGRDLVDRGVPVGVASAIWPHGRYRFDFAGEANHAGTTRMEDRRDPMLTYAMTALAANKQARLVRPARDVRPRRRPAQRHQRGPLGGHRVARRPRRVRGADSTPWSPRSSGWRNERAGRDGTALEVTAESVSPEVVFDADAARRLSAIGGAEPLAGDPDRRRATTPVCCRRRAGAARCCSCATRPASRTRPTSTPTSSDCLAGVEALAEVLAGVAGGFTPERSLPADPLHEGRLVMTAYWLEHAVVDGIVQDSVRVEIEDGVFTAVEVGAEQAGADRLAGLTIPGLANCHSHAFHRALRGRTQRERGTFWTWREQMYAVAGRLDPDGYYDLARATYREMLAAGFTSVGEFHYLHHGPDGTPYSDPNAMGLALVEAARDAGIRIALLDTCYLAAGIGREPEGVQRRFTDGDAGGLGRPRRPRWGSSAGPEGRTVVVGAAIHSVRAVPRDQMHFVAEWADRHQAPLHVHVSEQLAENVACLEAYGETPTGVLEEAGVAGPAHHRGARHPPHRRRRARCSGRPARTRASARPPSATSPTGSGRRGCCTRPAPRLTLGTDSHAVIDAFEEMRAVELDERLASQERGQWSASELLEAASSKGHRSLGFDGAGRIAVGAPADLVTLDLRSPRTAGTGATVETAVFAASAADVVHVVAQGKVVVERGDHREIGVALDRAVHRIWED